MATKFKIITALLAAYLLAAIAGAPVGLMQGWAL